MRRLPHRRADSPKLPTISPPPQSSGKIHRLRTASVPTRIRYFGAYEIIREIASRRMGVVYQARQVSLNRPVALKMLLAGQLARDDEVKRFYLEAEAATNIDHPGIVPFCEFGEHECQHYFSMGPWRKRSGCQLFLVSVLFWAKKVFTLVILPVRHQFR
jgi:serine/threonine protein kinase